MARRKRDTVYIFSGPDCRQDQSELSRSVRYHRVPTSHFTDDSVTPFTNSMFLYLISWFRRQLFLYDKLLSFGTTLFLVSQNGGQTLSLHVLCVHSKASNELININTTI
ncbi:hypothetical protein PISMIDRAFT_279314 [Pisolithus microcarpus 441]|uniref:Uncharacterized protein n=1 Tax=Pisolithus microcarpus 441 TaxID=765257 RepID=A0A0C9Z879_9AGAM|nr:hypothetical protein BKA83DRAFT_279314 [Pisolithus microcarpus]KIK16063.1 hypothetical protein PISMIDRAFT_279314 [Pisolithus microcarpus 441]